MTKTVVEYGDSVITGSCMTLDNTTGVLIYEFTPEKDGAYSVAASVLAWKPGGSADQWYVQAAWVRTGGVILADGTTFSGGVGGLNTQPVEHDVSGGKCRILVKGVSGEAVFWRLDGDRFDITA